MPVHLRIDVDGRARRNGRPDGLSASAAVFIFPDGIQERWMCTTQPPPHNQPQSATRQRAELTAIILALTTTLDKFQIARSNGFHPHLEVDICSFSEYTVNSLTLGYSWQNPLWGSRYGEPMVDDQDLISHALLLERSLSIHGNVRYRYVPQRENTAARARLCDWLMDWYDRGGGRDR